MKFKYKVEISTNLWIPPGSHICYHSSRPWCTPFILLQKGQIRAQEQQGCDWPLSKGRAGGEAGARMSGMLPDSG